MMIKKMKKKFLTLLFVFSFVLVILSSNTNNVLAMEVVANNIYQEAALNFFKAQYEERNICYDNVEVALENNLYSDSEEVVAKAVVIRRDDELDYVILNIATANIDEFAFNETQAYEKFSQKVYYSGVLNYYVKKNNQFHHFDNKKIISEKQFEKNSENIEKKFKLRKENAISFTNDNNPVLVNTKTGWNGFYNWTRISTANTNNSYSNTDWDYITGITPSGVLSGLTFMSQDDFNDHFETNNACGPTALTNMFIWFDYMNIENENNEVNALLNDNEFDTFDRFRTLVKHSNKDGTSRSKYNSALKNYAKDQGYDYEIDTGVNSFEEFKTNIENNMPILTSIDLDGWGGHAILVVGYEEFSQAYQVEHKVLWHSWTTTEYNYARYLRVIDGWDTSNDSRFIDFSGYWDTIEGRGFMIK